MQKFKQVQARDQVLIEKYLEANNLAYESSEDEDDGDNDEMRENLSKVLSHYKGEKTETERMLSYLTNVFETGGAVCLICISTVKRIDPVWNCGKCYAFLHLNCILHWVQDSLVYKHEHGIEPLWACPKCRTEYKEIPKVYKCFCGKTEDPSYQPWAIPHSCGKHCGKRLWPPCGHKCPLLCHPGPCPPCAQVVKAVCYCGKVAGALRRCNNKGWSCGSICGRKFSYCKHQCQIPCHEDKECPPCPEKAEVECHCGQHREFKYCKEANWTCDEPCGRLLSCGIHTCNYTCHRLGDCQQCPLEGNRTCPCGKKRYRGSCKNENGLLPQSCGDTCGKLLDCGLHFCSMRCHSDQCGQCLEVVVKVCKCGSLQKEYACVKELHCLKKCTQMRLCGQHLCNRKCCDCSKQNIANVCEKICGKSLNCRKHKCGAPCHSGPCYPCDKVEVRQCRCGNSKLSVPCGTGASVRPPTCKKRCKLAPICHHPKAETHLCHQGSCPPCKQVCGLIYKRCKHACVAPCHSKVWVAVKGDDMTVRHGAKTSMIRKTLPCPPCEVSVLVMCLGGHETTPLPCHASRSTSCGRLCGQPLPCGNHSCELECHRIKSSVEDERGMACMQCERPCSLSRATGCTHSCPKPCHPAPCAPCRQLVRLPCHCGINTLYRRCIELTSANTEQRMELLRCGNQCPKNYPCGHRCTNDCHAGECADANKCVRKVKLWCKCRRIKKDFKCLEVQKRTVTVDCDEVCQRLLNEKREREEAAIALQRQKEQLQNELEVKRFMGKFESRRKWRDKSESKNMKNKNDAGRYRKWLLPLMMVTVAVTAIYAAYQN